MLDRDGLLLDGRGKLRLVYIDADTNDRELPCLPFQDVFNEYTADFTVSDVNVVRPLYCCSRLGQRFDPLGYGKADGYGERELLFRVEEGGRE